MDLVVDANILFAALIKEGATSDLLFRDDFRLYSPEFIFEEFESYRKIIQEKTERSDEEFYHLIQVLKHRITIMLREEIEPFVEQARRISPDEKDVAYLALALKLGISLWSNDRDLKEKQNIVRVVSTSDLIHQS